jgi:hypothetical protein
MSTSPQFAVDPAHCDAIAALVAQTDRPPQEVAEIYMRVLARLREGARIQDYLVLLTSRHVREALRRSGSGGLLSPSSREGVARSAGVVTGARRQLTAVYREAHSRLKRKPAAIAIPTDFTGWSRT